MIKRNTKIDREKLARNETETDVQVSEREMDEGMVGVHARTHAH